MVKPGAVLATHNPQEFTNTPMHVRYVGDDVQIETTDRVTDFREMHIERKAGRENPNHLSELEQKLHGDGTELANVGVSVVIEANIQGKNYLVVTVADFDKKNLKDGERDPLQFARLISGYLPSDVATNPEAHALCEVSEELLVSRQRFGRDYFLQGHFDGEQLNTAYPDALPYTRWGNFELAKGADFQLPNSKKGDIQMNGRNLGDHAEFQTKANANSGLIIFKYSMNIDSARGMTFHYAEDIFDEKTEQLHSKYVSPERILLLELNSNSQLNGNAYFLEKGVLNKMPMPTHFSATFAQNQNGICNVSSLCLSDLPVTMYSANKS